MLTAFVLGGLNKLKTKVNVWLEARTTAAQREVIHKVAGEAFAFAQTTFKDAGGVHKMHEALQYASLRLTEQGIVYRLRSYKQQLRRHIWSIRLKQKRYSL
ncbi:hypothetical protein MKY75_13495 [Paenibacillus sp. FSL L8-0663]|uniref:hypothetical protein n=1 Tax=Paenibacillus sp. FSL L8-0663 TaxID=2921606 RepID=UPI0030F9DE30